MTKMAEEKNAYLTEFNSLKKKYEKIIEEL